jgi:1-deoxy-D-xylulose-5-phosphate synthase
VLSRVDTPDDLRRLTVPQVRELAEEIREFLVRKVAATGGHLGPNLGVVELTIALHRIFDSPADPLIFDTGHQAYVHKILTGRKDQFDSLRKQGGLSGYPSRAESAHDWVESSHASAALSYADGLAKAFALSGQDRHVVAVVGDGALTGGMCWEALNNIAAAPDRPVVVVVNDNGRSYAPTIGGLAERLTALRTQPAYEHALDAGKRILKSIPRVGESAYSMVHAVKAGIKDAVSPQELFSDLGLKYVGPVDGHDVVALESALRRAKDFGGPVVVHAVTQKGRGYAPAENHVADQMHACDPIDPLTGVLRGVDRARRAPRRHRRHHRGDAGPDRAGRVRRALPRPDVRRRHRRTARHGLRRGARARRHASGGGDLLDVPQPRLRPAAAGRRTAQVRRDLRPRPCGRHW